jgi:acyl carrier protein
MTQISTAQVRQFLLDRYAVALSAAGVVVDSISDDYDLLQEGVIDSLGILEMITAVETAFSIELDLENLDAESLTKVGPFCRYVEHFAQAQSKV